MQQRKVRRRLPLEMECEIFKCLKLEIQQKFIWRMGRGIYGMFGHQLLTKCKRLNNPKRNHLIRNKWYCPIPTDAIVEAFAHKGFDICVQSCRMGNFPGTVLYYFEVTKTSVYYFWQLYIGLSYGQKRENILIYSWPIGSDLYYLYGERHQFEWPNDAIRPKRNGNGDVYGCGLLLNLGLGYGQDPYTDFYGPVSPDPYDFGLIRIFTDSVFIRIFFSRIRNPYRVQIRIRSPDPYNFPYGLYGLIFSIDFISNIVI